MALYSQQCIHCKELIDGDASWCPFCLSHHPFGYQCWQCHKEVKKGQQLCTGCGNTLTVDCPSCTKKTFAQSRCEHCTQSLLQRCPNPRCQDWQFFLTKKCQSCGKLLRR